ncbi:MAG: glycine betaine/L-proline ABC transporter ATP-binding protein, partial [Steroidobacteraceae bacterium]
GRIVQVGTAEELLVSPADAYVAAFTRDAPRAKILTARAIMRAPAGAVNSGRSVDAATKVCDFAAAVEADERPFTVLEHGRVIGVVDRAAVMEVLVGTRWREP